MRINEREMNNSYMAYARGAVRAEHQANYLSASELWIKASNTPCNKNNRFWADYRAAHCAHAAQKQWGNPNASQAV
uniref:ANR family transcriptional regulator n=1 Tax=Serratia proteamaculans TaxID=28151 RepID=UPI001F4C05CC|nr:ANR family transcriptional regulator [Serratia proteamaculans]